MRVTLEKVGHRYPSGSWLFRGIDIALEAGQSYALTGPSGSGKSTLLNLLAGWLPPAEGQIIREGRGRTGWVFQNPHGTPRRTARDHVMFPLLAQGLSITEAHNRGMDLLARFGLRHAGARRFMDLSGGEAQRLMLACGLAASPGLLLVDEPTAQLDFATSREVNSAINELSGRESIVVIATHDMDTVKACTGVLNLADVHDWSAGEL